MIWAVKRLKDHVISRERPENFPEKKNRNTFVFYRRSVKCDPTESLPDLLERTIPSQPDRSIIHLFMSIDLKPSSSDHHHHHPSLPMIPHIRISTLPASGILYPNYTLTSLAPAIGLLALAREARVSLGFCIPESDLLRFHSIAFNLINFVRTDLKLK
ncbi:hypothetical protein MJO28_016318 [Puccinia striiformis f. sp. tritici]|uniref:Uncharacterized protein n=1 Tax=Puccinia striiformis f. sp. tritici TaxID=168172 RepID=A0ACC0DN26_9BASI|nr:hypothetical protein MJO28_016318 [Puccinia striiformis f. sp. tritici]